MITKDEVFDEAMKAALHIMAMPKAADVLTRLERLYLDAYERGMKDAGDNLMQAAMQIDMEEILRKAQ